MNTNTFLRLPYAPRRYGATRWETRRVRVGGLGIGGLEPVRIQSMTTTLTTDVEATVRQVLQLAEAGSELVRITAPHMRAAEALGAIRKAVRAAGVEVPLVADIHFLPQAAMEAAKHVEKVRINPGNYADRKKFAMRSYTDAQYEEELQRLYEAFSPLVLRCKENGCAIRIGTNHGSLSDRIMNRYGDTPLGMVASALEFIDIAESHGFGDIVLSMKASNPKIMLQAYRLAAAMMAQRGMQYPLHLGVTEAGGGEDARIKSAIGIGSLLEEGLGDTIRVSLTEDPVAELPFARALAQRAMRLWERGGAPTQVFEALPHEVPSPYVYERTEVSALDLGAGRGVQTDGPPRVILDLRGQGTEGLEGKLELLKSLYSEAFPLEGVLLQRGQVLEWDVFLKASLDSVFWALELAEADTPQGLGVLDFFLQKALARPTLLCLGAAQLAALPQWLEWAQGFEGLTLVVDAGPSGLEPYLECLKQTAPQRLCYALTGPVGGCHALGSYRQLADFLRKHGLKSPLWLRLGAALVPGRDVDTRLIESSILAGGLLCEGLGNLLSLEFNAGDLEVAHRLSYAILQGARARYSKTEFVACPSCGRTLFDLQSTTEGIQKRTGHLRGVTIAVMGCIVNGPGEMADADFGYVGGAPGKVNLYKGKACVRMGVPEAEAVESLVGLLKEHGAWVEPPQRL